MKKVNREEFYQEIQEGITLVDVYADWCGPCKMIAPIIERIQELNPNIKVIKVDADSEGALMQELVIGSIPALLFYKDNKEIHRTLGFQSQTIIQRVIDGL